MNCKLTQHAITNLPDDRSDGEETERREETTGGVTGLNSTLNFRVRNRRRAPEFTPVIMAAG